MPFTIIRQDITKMQVDAIVNAANTELLMGSGVCGAIFRAAGAQELQAACEPLAPIHTGEAVITPGFALPARHVIHAAGPVYSRQEPAHSEALLRAAYLSALTCAADNDCASIAFPLISSGIYGYPKTEALRVASAAIRSFLEDHDMEVYLAVFDKEAFAASRALMGEVASYVDEHYVDEDHAARRRRGLLSVERRQLERAQNIPFDAPLYPAAAMPDAAAPGKPKRAKGDLEAALAELDEPFSDTLLRLIDAKGKSDVEVYKRANIDRKLFSKIRTGKGYTPKKSTILALAIALELDLRETDRLLRRAGYALSHASKFDVIVEYFIINGNYDIYALNEVLFQYDLPLLGA